MTELIEVQFQDQERYKQMLALILEIADSGKSAHEKVYAIREIVKGALK